MVLIYTFGFNYFKNRKSSDDNFQLINKYSVVKIQQTSFYFSKHYSFRHYFENLTYYD